MPNSDTSSTSRIHAIDALRGFALLGILVVNIQSFSMINAAFHNPAAYGDLGGWNYWVWFYTYSLVDSKFLALFSMLFGVSMLLIHQRYESVGFDNVVTYQKRRFAILIVIGLLHAYLIWPGDILVTYGLCGLLLLPAVQMRLSPRILIISGVFLLSIPSLNMLGSVVSPDLLDAGEKAQISEQWSPSPNSYQDELAAYRGHWLAQQSQRAQETLSVHIQNLPLTLVWRVGGLMLIGMALFKLGIVSAVRSLRFYRCMTLVGIGIGAPLMFYNSQQWSNTQWSLAYYESIGFQINYWCGLLLAGGYIGLIMWLCLTGRLIWLISLLAQVGRMALSNYLLQSLLCTLIFYGHGLGLFGKLERTEQLAVVVLVWLINLIFSTIWLKYYWQGPIEFIWRRLCQGDSKRMKGVKLKESTPFKTGFRNN